MGFEPTRPSLKRLVPWTRLAADRKMHLYPNRVGKRGAGPGRRAKDEQVRCEPRYVRVHSLALAGPAGRVCVGETLDYFAGRLRGERLVAPPASA